MLKDMRKFYFFLLLGLWALPSCAQTTKEIARQAGLNLLRQNAAQGVGRLASGAAFSVGLARWPTGSVQVPYTFGPMDDLFRLSVEENLNRALRYEINTNENLLPPFRRAEEAFLRQRGALRIQMRSREVLSALAAARAWPKRVVGRSFSFRSVLPEDGRVILVGEKHFEHLFKVPVMQLLEEYRRAGKEVYLATEFAYSDLSDGRLFYRPSELDRLASRGYYIGMLEFARQNGVSVIPLESAEMLKIPQQQAGMLSLSEEEKLRWQMSTFVLLRERNLQWARRINAVLAARPEAVVIVHCGSAHSEYYSAFEPTLTALLSEQKPVVLLAFGGKYGGARQDLAQRSLLLEHRAWARHYYAHALPPETARVMGADVFVHLPDIGTPEYQEARHTWLKGWSEYNEHDRSVRFLPPVHRALTLEEEYSWRVRRD